MQEKKILKAVILTLSDRASQGVYEDKSGVILQEMLTEYYNSKNRVIEFDYQVIPDDEAVLANNILKGKNEAVDFIFTTGGTGIGPRDITTDVLKSLLDKELPGIMEFIRMKYGALFPLALISRSIAGVTGTSLVFALPGSPRAVKEYMDEILKVLDHCVRMIHGVDKH